MIDNHVRDYRRFSEKEIAPAMEEVVNQHEEVKAAEATAAKPAEPTKPTLSDSKTQEILQKNFEFDKITVELLPKQTIFEEEKKSLNK